VKHRGTRVSVAVGDLFDQSMDALILSAGGSLQASFAGSLMSQLRRLGGADLVAQLDRAVDRAPHLGEVIVVDGGETVAARLLLVVTHDAPPPSEDEEGWTHPIVGAISRGVSEALAVAGDLGVRSVALPLMGLGGLGVPESAALPVLAEALRAGLDRGGRNAPKRVTVVARSKVLQRRFVAALRGPGEDDAAELIADVASAAMSAVATGSTVGLTGAGVVASTVLSGTWLWGSVLGRAAAGIAGPGGVARSTERKHDERLDLGRAIARIQELRITERNLQQRLAEAEAELERLRTELERRGRPTSAVRLAMPVAYADALVRSSAGGERQQRHLVAAYLILARYCACLLLADYCSLATRPGEVDARLREVLDRADGPRGDGHWAEIVRVLAPILAAAPDSHLGTLACLRPQKRRAPGPGVGKLLGLKNWRDRVSHPSGPYETDDREGQERWEAAVDALEGLLSIPLFSVEAIEDVTQDALAYGIRWLTGEAMVPRSEVVLWTKRLPKGQLYLQLEPEGERFLPLEPFLRYEICGVTHTREPFAFDRLQGDEVVFSAFRFGITAPYPAERPLCLGG
jgi:O-acetyl-ADP-ribose deacetylase (regulator of RNase III)